MCRNVLECTRREVLKIHSLKMYREMKGNEIDFHFNFNKYFNSIYIWVMNKNDPFLFGYLHRIAYSKNNLSAIFIRLLDIGFIEY